MLFRSNTNLNVVAEIELPVWSPAAGAHLPGLTCFASKDALLHILCSISGHMTYCVLPFSFKQSSLSPLTSTSTKICCASMFSLFQTVACNLRDNCVGRPSQCSESLKSSFCLVLMLDLNFSRSSLPRLRA